MSPYAARVKQISLLFRCFATLLALLWAIAPAAAQDGELRYALDPAHSSIGFSIGHFVVSSTEGRFVSFDGRLTAPPGAPEHGSVVIHVSPASIDTGIGARDDHLRSADFFDIARFPAATFESSGLVLTGGNKGRLTGMLTLHGVTRPISLDIVLQSPDRSAAQLDFSAAGSLKRSAFGMSGYQGMIGDDVTLTIVARFDRVR
jgi:polyisoprenoid-binding protein YceI